jgi:hypothetical protein
MYVFLNLCILTTYVVKYFIKKMRVMANVKYLYLIDNIYNI